MKELYLYLNNNEISDIKGLNAFGLGSSIRLYSLDINL